MIIRDQFGFLPIEMNLECSNLKVYCVDNFHKTFKSLQKAAYSDGFIYPPTIYRVKKDPSTKRKIRRIPNSKRPALMYRILPSHHIEFDTEIMKEENELRNGLFGFVMYLIGYIYGIRLQFHDWWFDGRTPFQSQHNIYITKEKLIFFMEYTIKKFNSMNHDKKKFITNILYMHNRSPLYEWDWEQFIIEYMVFDACWNFSELEKTKTPHKARIKKICTEYGLYQDADVIEKIVYLRNNLFHESLWCGERPCTTADNDDFFVSYHFRRLNQRLIPALLGYNSNYVRSNWTCMGSFLFD
jgi:hypothetical protein